MTEVELQHMTRQLKDLTEAVADGSGNAELCEAIHRLADVLEALGVQQAAHAEEIEER
ncbi:hypothetical protein [Streptomyces sp. 4N124]|uniref:hypothetical protein n=1 Tax=Streptomyces sp. 4N124 TaxID=3457420 RepID=UPI003FD0FD96